MWPAVKIFPRGQDFTALLRFLNGIPTANAIPSAKCIQKIGQNSLFMEVYSILLFKGEPDGRVLYSRAHVTGQYGTKR